MSPAITLRVITPQRIELDTEVSSMKFPGVDGSIGVLPRHAPMVAAVDPGELEFRKTPGGPEEFFVVSGGFAAVRDNTVRIVTDACERPTDIDTERAAEASERARARLRERISLDGEGKVPLDVLRAEASLRRALMRQSVARKRR
jgi:F-type H+-transporting ATPase subunit epsilon